MVTVPLPLSRLLASDPPRERKGVVVAATAAVFLHLVAVVVLVWVTAAERWRAGADWRVTWLQGEAEDEAVIVFFDRPSAPAGGSPAPQETQPQPAGPQVPAIVAPEGGGTPTPAPTPPPPPTTAPAGPAGTGGGGGEGRAPATAAEALRPRAGDPRLWAPIPTLPTPKTKEERATERVYARIQQFNDSVMAAAEAARRATDWTVTGKDGERWGISPGKLHLGKITLPLPFGFQAPPGRREETAERLREWSEIEDQALRAQIRDQFNERVKQMNERKERERQEKQEAERAASGN